MELSEAKTKKLKLGVTAPQQTLSQGWVMVHDQRPRDVERDMFMGGSLCAGSPGAAGWTKHPWPALIVEELPQRLSSLHLARPAFQGHQRLPSRHSSLQRRCPGWPTVEPLTLNTKQHVLLHILLDGNIEGGWDLCLLKTRAFRVCLYHPAFQHVPYNQASWF